MNAHTRLRHEGMQQLRLSVPDDPRFAPLVRAACRIVARSMRDGERLAREVDAAVADPADRALRGAGENPVQVELSFDSGSLEVVFASNRGRIAHRFPAEPQ